MCVIYTWRCLTSKTVSDPSAKLTVMVVKLLNKIRNQIRLLSSHCLILQRLYSWIVLRTAQKLWEHICVKMDAVNQVYATDNEKEKILLGNDLLLKFCPLLNLIHKTIWLRWRDNIPCSSLIRERKPKMLLLAVIGRPTAPVLFMTLP